MPLMLTTPRGAVTLRPTQEDDALAYRALRLEGLERHPEAFGSDYADSAERPLAYWQEQMRQGTPGDQGVTYVAEAAGALVGMTRLTRNEGAKLRHSGWIFSVYVAPAWRGVGVADALMAACLEHGRALGLRLVRLGVATANVSAIRLYLRHGFRVHGVEHEALYVAGTYYDELLMTLQLQSQ